MSRKKNYVLSREKELENYLNNLCMKDQEMKWLIEGKGYELNETNLLSRDQNNSVKLFPFVCFDYVYDIALQDAPEFEVIQDTIFDLNKLYRDITCIQVKPECVEDILKFLESHVLVEVIDKYGERLDNLQIKLFEIINHLEDVTYKDIVNQEQLFRERAVDLESAIFFDRPDICGVVPLTGIEWLDEVKNKLTWKNHVKRMCGTMNQLTSMSQVSRRIYAESIISNIEEDGWIRFKKCTNETEFFEYTHVPTFAALGFLCKYLVEYEKEAVAIPGLLSGISKIAPNTVYNYLFGPKEYPITGFVLLNTLLMFGEYTHALFLHEFDITFNEFDKIIACELWMSFKSRHIKNKRLKKIGLTFYEYSEKKYEAFTKKYQEVIVFESMKKEPSCIEMIRNRDVFFQIPDSDYLLFSEDYKINSEEKYEVYFVEREKYQLFEEKMIEKGLVLENLEYVFELQYSTSRTGKTFFNTN